MRGFDLLQYVLNRLPVERADLEPIATGSGVPIHTIIKIHSGETTNPRHETLKQLATYLHANGYRPKQQRAAAG